MVFFVLNWRNPTDITFKIQKTIRIDLNLWVMALFVVNPDRFDALKKIPIALSALLIKVGFLINWFLILVKTIITQVHENLRLVDRFFCILINLIFKWV